MLSYEEIKLIHAQYKNLHCNVDDFHVQYQMITELAPEYIFEFGVGHGEWIKAMDEALDYDAYFVGIENFASAYMEKDYYGPMPKTPQELRDYIGMWNFNHFYTVHEACASFPCEFARIDMNMHQMSMDLITETAQIISIDDAYKEKYASRVTMALQNGRMRIDQDGNQEIFLRAN